LVFGSILENKEFRERLKEEDPNDAQDFLEEKGIFLKINLLEALEFINKPNELSKIDYVVLDVDMPLQDEDDIDNENYLSSLIEKYDSKDDLRKIAGYQIYTELVIELGFPKSHILFCSNHANYFEELKSKFNSANIKYPISPNPDKPFLEKEDKDLIKQWLDDAHSDYFVLRRGIIEACNHLKTLSDAKLDFNGFINEKGKKVSLDEMHDYLGVLANFLPLREPDNKATFYKLFVRTLAHEWEAAKEVKDLAWIMKSTRNWIAHNSKLFDALDEQTVAYLFIINMRLMFNLGNKVLPYEKKLLALFDKEALSDQEFRTINANSRIPTNKAYRDLKNLVQDERAYVNDAFPFGKLANNIQESNSGFRDDKPLFTKLLYQIFWLNTSNPTVSTGKKRNVLEIQFWNFNYAKEPYIFEIARHIYKRSFLEN